ncbi:MAG: phosphatase PAP2 family protein [Acidimicrobiia bacterium]
MVVVIALGAGVVVAGAVAGLASRWPAVQAPTVSGERIVDEVRRHRRLAQRLRRHFDPSTETGLALVVATTVFAATAVGVGVLLAMLRAKTGLESVDVALARFGARQATAQSTEALRWLSELGGTRGVLLVAATACVLELIRRPTAALPLFLTLVVGGQFALSNGVKYLVERARPDFSRLTGFAGTSFPSGHATAAAATLAAVALLTTRGRSKAWKIGAAAVAAGLAAVVAMTRVFLGVHWFSDVVAGLFLGWGWFALCSIAFGGRLLVFGLPVAAAEAVADVVASENTPSGRRETEAAAGS